MSSRLLAESLRASVSLFVTESYEFLSIHEIPVAGGYERQLVN